MGEEEIGGGLIATSIVAIVLYRGELPRGDVENALGTNDRHARRVVAALKAREVVVLSERR